MARTLRRKLARHVAKRLLAGDAVIYLTMATTNTKKLLENVEDALKNGI